MVFRSLLTVLLLLPLLHSSASVHAQSHTSDAETSPTPSITPTRFQPDPASGPETGGRDGAEASEDAAQPTARELEAQQLIRKYRQRRINGATVLALGLLLPAITTGVALPMDKCRGGEDIDFCGFGSGIAIMAVSAASLPLVIGGAVVLGRSSRHLRALERQGPRVVGLPRGAGLVWSTRF